MSAWYESAISEFLGATTDVVIGTLATAAARDGWETPPAQEKEWNASIDLLKESLTKTQNERLAVLQSALSDPRLDEFRDVVLEYDFRRRGLRMDCVLLAPGLIVVLEFKRSEPTSGDRDQVMNYAINLCEFHELTQDLVKTGNAIVVPIVVSTRSEINSNPSFLFHEEPWGNVIKRSILSDACKLSDLLAELLSQRKSFVSIDRRQWIDSRFRPSSSILDAAVSLYGQHEVASITDHALPTKLIERCIREVADAVEEVRDARSRRVIFVSGAPGAGKTLVGLQLLFSTSRAIFVTGNAPLVDVLQLALKNSYKAKNVKNQLVVPSGYKRQQMEQLIDMATFSIEKAHRFLKSRSSHATNGHETLVVFDEAQRTYLEGRSVVDERLEKDEAKLVLEALERDNPDDGLVVVCLVGHNQAINTGESGICSWFDAVENTPGWEFQISDTTLALPELFDSNSTKEKWAMHDSRLSLEHGHLDHSLRYYRNREIEKWAGAVVARDQGGAAEIARMLKSQGSEVVLTRDLESAKSWVRKHRVGDDRAGMVASSQARRLIAEGVYVLPQADSKIAHWMLAPSGDIRSSNMLEVAQNQFQIQGLELDYTILCWDADFRYTDNHWEVHNISGRGWQKQSKPDELSYRENSYRVLLTRARKGMVIFVPKGDQTFEDSSRKPSFYDDVFTFLKECGCRELDE
jgi:hypothetical protein